jgi:ComF family protein
MTEKEERTARAGREEKVEMAEMARNSAIPTTAEALGSALSPKCSRCERHPPGYASLVAAIDYAYPGDMLIQRFKEGARLAYAGMFARLLWGRLQASASDGQGKVSFSALAPIPSSQSALKRRGFNPAAELARELSRLSGHQVQHGWLTRTRETTTQKTLSAQARRASVSGLYACPNAVPRVWIGVVDDVVTTGSTMDTAARALLSAGAAGVIGLAAAHTPRAWQNDAYD